MNMIRAGREELKSALKTIGTAAETNGNLACRETTLGDLAVAAHLSALDYFGEVPWSDFAAAGEWYVRMKSRPPSAPCCRTACPASRRSPTMPNWISEPARAGCGKL